MARRRRNKEYVVPPELRAPRRCVRLRPFGGLWSRWTLYLFMLPFVVSAAWVAFAMPGSILWATAGHDYRAPVVHMSASRTKNSVKHRVTYVYRPRGGGGPREGKSTVTAELYDRLRATPPPARIVNVRALGTWPFGWDDVVDTPADAWQRVAFIWVFGLFWVGGTAFGSFQAYVKPHRLRALYRRGVPTHGHLVDKTRSRRRGEFSGHTYSVEYSYAAADGRKRRQTMPTSGYLWHRAPERGPNFTVLYDPARPDRSVLYELGPYQCAPPRWVETFVVAAETKAEG